MKSIAQEYYPVAIHEYTHLVVEHSGLPLPPWLNEGLAEVYSTLKPDGKRVRFGDILIGRVRELQNGQRLDPQPLPAARPKSPVYNQKQTPPLIHPPPS